MAGFCLGEFLSPYVLVSGALGSVIYTWIEAAFDGVLISSRAECLRSVYKCLQLIFIRFRKEGFRPHSARDATPYNPSPNYLR